MEWSELMNEALEYSERNLSISLSPDEVAPKVGVSSYNFQRLFSFVTGYSFAYYVRKRVMDEALKDLLSGREGILEIALKYGYTNASSFTKAFKALYGVSPSEATDEGVLLSSFPPIVFASSKKGNEIMDFVIKKKGALTLSGPSIKVNNTNGENFKVIPEFWAQTAKSGDLEKLCVNEGGGLYGVCYDCLKGCSSFRYMIASEGKKEGFETILIPAAEYAVFPVHGVKELQETTRRIFAEWLPSSPFVHGPSPELEYYPEEGGKEEMPCEIWIPIVRK